MNDELFWIVHKSSIDYGTESRINIFITMTTSSSILYIFRGQCVSHSDDRVSTHKAPELVLSPVVRASGSDRNNDIPVTCDIGDVERILSKMVVL